jgi:hypothetical protein
MLDFDWPRNARDDAADSGQLGRWSGPSFKAQPTCSVHVGRRRATTIIVPRTGACGHHFGPPRLS